MGRKGDVVFFLFGETEEKSNHLNDLARVLKEQGDYPNAESLYEQAMGLFHEVLSRKNQPID